MRAIGVLYLPSGSGMSYSVAGPLSFTSRVTGSPLSLKPKIDTVTLDSGPPRASDSLPVKCPGLAPGGGGPPDPELRSQPHVASAAAINNPRNPSRIIRPCYRMHARR